MLLRVFILTLLPVGPVAHRESSIALRQRLFDNPLVSDSSTFGPSSYYQAQTWKYAVGRTEYSLGPLQRTSS